MDFCRMANGAVNLEIYSQILRTGVFLFIQYHYRDGPYYFWPGLVFAHDIWDGLQVLQNNGIWFIPKQMNPLTVVSHIPIKDYSGALKKDTHDVGLSAKSFDELRERIKRKFPIKTITKLF